MVRKVNFFLFLFVVLFSLAFISAIPPQTFSNTNVGIDIEHPIATAFEVDKAHEFHFHLFNRSTGLPLVTAQPTCLFHLYDPSGVDIYINNSVLNESLYDWSVYVGGGNFSYVGDYAFVFQCNTSIIGGFYEHDFEVTPSGNEFTTASSLIEVALLFLFVIVFVGGAVAISFLPSANARDEEGRMMSISWLKYLRGALWFVEYILFIAILFMASNLAYAFLSERLLASVLFALYKIAYRLVPVVLIVWVAWLFVKIFQDKKFWSMINRGIFPQGRL